LGRAALRALLATLDMELHQSLFANKSQFIASQRRTTSIESQLGVARLILVQVSTESVVAAAGSAS
jgi:hypothetical protein